MSNFIFTIPCILVQRQMYAFLGGWNYRGGVKCYYCFSVHIQTFLQFLRNILWKHIIWISQDNLGKDTNRSSFSNVRHQSKCTWCQAIITHSRQGWVDSYSHIKIMLATSSYIRIYVVGSKSFRPDVQKPRQMENLLYIRNQSVPHSKHFPPRL